MNERLLEIEISKLKLRAIIGINDWEREKLQDIIISIKFRYNANEAIKNDSVEKAINYRTITKKVIKLVDNSNFFLVETLADKILQLVCSFEGVKNAHVVLEKPNSLRFCDNLIVKVSNYG